MSRGHPECVQHRCPGNEKLRKRRRNWVVHDPSASWPGLSRPPTRRRCGQLLKFAIASERGCPTQGHGCPVRQKKSRHARKSKGSTTPGVLAGLVPAIPRRMRSIRPHAAPLQETCEVVGRRSAWMPGTSPGRTREGCERLELYNRSRRTGQPWHKAGHDALGLQNTEYCNRILFSGRPCPCGGGLGRWVALTSANPRKDP
jgi:hypothetical protein